MSGFSTEASWDVSQGRRWWRGAPAKRSCPVSMPLVAKVSNSLNNSLSHVTNSPTPSPIELALWRPRIHWAFRSQLDSHTSSLPYSEIVKVISSENFTDKQTCCHSLGSPTKPNDSPGWKSHVSQPVRGDREHGTFGILLSAQHSSDCSSSGAPSDTDFRPTSIDRFTAMPGRRNEHVHFESQAAAVSLTIYKGVGGQDNANGARQSVSSTGTRTSVFLAVDIQLTLFRQRFSAGNDILCSTPR
jgi:hypothetical protein